MFPRPEGGWPSFQAPRPPFLEHLPPHCYHQKEAELKTGGPRAKHRVPVQPTGDLRSLVNGQSCKEGPEPGSQPQCECHTG